MIKSRCCRKARLEQVGDIFMLTLVDTGEVKEFKNPIEAKRLYDIYLTDNRGFGDELQANGYNRYTGKKEVVAVECQ